ncbi:MAG: UDP-glucose 4-epimerase GalE, partial [Clostridia bacterium]|nr:UDP-glucose 4-epimerase GalE [Clostridia bacterium]
LNAGHDVVVLDNFCNSSPEAIRRVEAITGKKVALYEGDCCNEAVLNHVLDREEIDAAVHFAGLKAVGESVSIPLRYYENNLGATITLCKALSAHNVKRIVFSSSATVYGDSEIVPMHEMLPMGECTNPYGWTKWMSERILRDLSFADKDWSVVLLRYFNPVGAHESGLIGEDPSGIPNNLMPFITKVAAGQLDHLTVMGDDYATHDGTGVRDYIHVVDLACGHVKACEYAASHAGCEIFNLGTGVGYSVLDIVNTFSRVNGIDLPYVIGPRRPGDVDACFADPAKAREVLGWEAQRTLEDMCRDAWHWQKNNPRGYKAD